MLLELFGRPADFIHAIQPLFERYSNRTIRTKATPLATVLPTYHVPIAILKHLDLILTPRVLANPAEAIQLTLELWKNGTFEGRTLAAMIIGKTDAEFDLYDEVLTKFVYESTDDDLVVKLITKGMEKVRSKYPKKFLKLMFKWCATHDDRMTINAFNALIYHINEDDNINLPQVIGIVLLPLRSMPQSFQYILIDLIKGLYNHSPVETSYFIKQLFMEPVNPMMPVIFRRILPSLPSEIQATVTGLLREKSPLHKKLI